MWNRRQVLVVRGVMRVGAVLLALLMWTLTLIGCATTATNAPTAELVTKVTPAAAGPDGLDVYDAGMLLARGLDLLQGGAPADAAPYFERLIREFPNDENVILAHYNRGLAYLRLQRGEEALAAFDAYNAMLGPNASGKDVLDGRFKRGEALAVSKRYQEVADLFDDMLGEQLAPDDRIEALVDAGIGHYMLGLEAGGDQVHRPTAETRFLEARRWHRDESKTRRMDHMNFHLAQASFYLGELARLDFNEYRLTWPTDVELAAAKQKQKDASIESVLSDHLEEKCQRLLRAQYAYLRAIREGHAGWASASGFNVGQMYEDLHSEMSRLPIPPDLTPEQSELYRSIVQKRLLILLEKAEGTWSKTADMVTRTGAESEWSQRTRASLVRIRTKLVDEQEAVAHIDTDGADVKGSDVATATAKAGGSS
jgi:tetratricopeptide (TPR) repeat protein